MEVLTIVSRSRHEGNSGGWSGLHGDGGLDEARGRPARGARRWPARLLQRAAFGAKMKLGGSQRPALSPWKELEYDGTDGVGGRRWL
jgi:hypothetical protein